ALQLQVLGVAVGAQTLVALGAVLLQERLLVDRPFRRRRHTHRSDPYEKPFPLEVARVQAGAKFIEDRVCSPAPQPAPARGRQARMAIRDLVRPANRSSRWRASGKRNRNWVLSSRRACWTSRMAAPTSAARSAKPCGFFISARARLCSLRQWKKGEEK